MDPTGNLTLTSPSRRPHLTLTLLKFQPSRGLIDLYYQQTAERKLPQQTPYRIYSNQARAHVDIFPPYLLFIQVLALPYCSLAPWLWNNLFSSISSDDSTKPNQWVILTIPNIIQMNSLKKIIQICSGKIVGHFSTKIAHFQLNFKFYSLPQYEAKHVNHSCP